MFTLLKYYPEVNPATLKSAIHHLLNIYYELGHPTTKQIIFISSSLETTQMLNDMEINKSLGFTDILTIPTYADYIHFIYTNPILIEQPIKTLFIAIQTYNEKNWFSYDNLISTIYEVYKIDITIPTNEDISNNNSSYMTTVTNTNWKFQKTYILKECNIDKYMYINTEEYALINKIREVIIRGIEKKQERTGISTFALFGGILTFNITHTFPLMTARPHSFRMIFEELMWILRGQTTVNHLEEKKIYIWSQNATTEFIQKQQLNIHLDTGDIGESYGYNMRRYNDSYDQLDATIKLLKQNPDSRRIIINLWNPAAIKRAALPPCLCWYQFFVRKESNFTYLDCQAMNRSSDIAVAGGWNISTAALLIYILAATCNMTPGRLNWVMGDIHIYKNNLDAAKIITARTPNIYPTLLIKKSLNYIEDILTLQYTDMRLINYNPKTPQIKLIMNP